MSIKISVIGGDMRQIYLSNIMSEEKEVYIYGNEHEKLSSNVNVASTLEEALKDSHYIICPIPFSKDKKHIYATNSKQKINYMDVFRLMKKDACIFSGPYSKEVLKYASNNNIRLFDVVSDDEFAIHNSIPTAEGVISLMINSLPGTLSGSKCLVLGYGRCGMAITDLAIKHRMNVCVASVKDEELMKASINKCDTARIQGKKMKVIDYFNQKAIDNKNNYLDLHTFNYVINTIPVKLIDINLSKKLEDYIFIDIANVYNDTVNKFINARGIPGKYSPKSAARIIYDVIDKVIGRS
jgi:dipicolinate synthase subunit A